MTGSRSATRWLVTVSLPVGFVSARFRDEALAAASGLFPNTTGLTVVSCVSAAVAADERPDELAAELIREAVRIARTVERPDGRFAIELTEDS